MSVHVFLGPTLPVREAQAILPGARYWPPAAMGDVLRITLTEAPRVIALVDGLFELTPAVWHKEILYALSRGVRVLGASSMGALRAAELHAHGMEGHGRVFEAFRDGVLSDDDEVALTHAAAEDGYRPLSEAMVNVRHALRLADEGSTIGAALREMLVREAKTMFYPDRSWPAIFARSRSLGADPVELGRLRDFLRREKPDLKRDDAVSLLRTIAEDIASPGHGAASLPIATSVPPTPFEVTTFFTKLTHTALAAR